MLIAPCTASTMGKMAHGIADNMLITTYLSMKAPVFIAPAMDLDMYKHPSTQANMKTLLGYGNHIIEPEVGFLASGLEGKGRMEEPDIIVECLDRFFDEQAQQNAETDEAASENCKEKESDKLDLKGKKIMITAGPTYEKIDPVRFIGNYSSGKMGFALAEECCRRGAEVTLVAGPVSLSCSEAIHRIDVESCEEMYQAATKAFASTDAAILCAAVADFKPSEIADRKIKREKDDLELGYRTSIIAKKGYTVLGAEIELQEGEKEAIRTRMNELKEKRVTKQPLEYPSAGSTFKRPEGYFAGKLVQDAGLRGFRVGDAMVSEKHCGFVINAGEATAAQVDELMKQVSAKVREQFGVTLEPEVKRLGEF